VFLIVAGIVIVYVLLVLAMPTGRCWWCRGKPRRGCLHCRNTGRVYHVGATAIHRFYWSALGNRLRDRRREQLAEAREAAK
jgi:hypothetical protein